MYAVIDVGKTNKKVVVYDRKMELLASEKRKFAEKTVSGLRIENVETIYDWVLETLAGLNMRYPVKGIAVTTQGATLVCVDGQGRPSVPPVDYACEVDEAVHRGFWEAVGDSREIQRKTATAEVKPLINCAKLIWFMKNRWPEAFSRTTDILFYPQYFGFRLTGRKSVDITYTGCHTFLWDYTKGDWSDVAKKLGILNMLPGLPRLPTEKLGTVSPQTVAKSGLSPDTEVTLGIHDSNSSLIPYLITQKQDFVLNSTGTWCVAMRPAEGVSFDETELGKMVFYNLSFMGRPVKTSIFLGGLEYAFYTDLLMRHHNRGDWPDYNPQVYSAILSNPKTFLLPTIVPGSGQFPHSEAKIVDGETEYSMDDIRAGRKWPKAFEDYPAGFALANLSLAIQTTVALRRVGLKTGTEVFIEGGFRQNPHYKVLLSALLPDNPVFVTEMEEATSFGAALTAKAMMDGVSVNSLKDFVNLEKQAVNPGRLEGLEAYAQAFLKRCV